MYSVPLTEVSGAVQTLEKLFSSIVYRGIFSTEFKYDQRDTLYKVIEVNVRPWWYIEFAKSCGINFCKLAYQDALNQNITEQKHYKVGKKLVYLYYDLLSYLELHRLGKITTWSWIKSFWRSTYPIFSWTDPVPALVKSFVWFRDFFKRHLFQ
jgi:predicted ATP-grasp superfamily ATP-dependent carboligase